MVYSIMEVHGVVVETCARCGRPSPDVISGEYIEWIPYGDEQMLCPDCITPYEQQEIDEDDMNFVDGLRSWRREVGISTDRSQGDYAAEKVRENRLRRAAERQELQLVKSRRRDPRARDYGLYRLMRPDGITVAEGTINDVEDWLTAPPGLIFAFRDDGDGSWAGHWYPCRPDYILPDAWAVGASLQLPSHSSSPFAGHKLVFAYEDVPSGRLRDDSSGLLYRLRDRRPRRTTAVVHDAIWNPGDEQTPLRRAATMLAHAMQALAVHSPGVHVRTDLDDLVDQLAHAQLSQEAAPLLAAAQAVLSTADRLPSRVHVLHEGMSPWEREAWVAIEMLRAACMRYPAMPGEQTRSAPPK